mgnify:CR=1 FL=1
MRVYLMWQVVTLALSLNPRWHARILCDRLLLSPFHSIQGDMRVSYVTGCYSRPFTQSKSLSTYYYKQKLCWVIFFFNFKTSPYKDRSTIKTYIRYQKSSLSVHCNWVSLSWPFRYVDNFVSSGQWSIGGKLLYPNWIGMYVNYE